MRFIGPEIDLLVVSPGGVGTTFLIKFLRQFVRTNCPFDTDSLKHAPIPPFSLNPRLRIIYLFGDPISAVLSLFRRGYHAVHSRKMMEGFHGRTVPWNETLESYAQGGYDGFRFDRHWRNYAIEHLAAPTLFLRYESIWNHIPELLEFARIPAEHAGAFPEQRTRAAHESPICSGVMESLEHIYGSWRRSSAALPDFEIRWPGGFLGGRIRSAGFAALGTLQRALRPRRQPREPLPESFLGHFAVTGASGEAASKLARLGLREERRLACLEDVSEPGPEPMIPGRYSRRTITLGDEFLAARDVRGADALRRFLRSRFALCDEARALPILFLRGGQSFLDWSD